MTRPSREAACSQKHSTFSHSSPPLLQGSLKERKPSQTTAGQWSMAQSLRACQSFQTSRPASIGLLDSQRLEELAVSSKNTMIDPYSQLLATRCASGFHSTSNLSHLFSATSPKMFLFSQRLSHSPWLRDRSGTKESTFARMRPIHSTKFKDTMNFSTNQGSQSAISLKPSRSSLMMKYKELASKRDVQSTQLMCSSIMTAVGHRCLGSHLHQLRIWTTTRPSRHYS